MIDDENDRLMEKIKYTKEEMNHWAYSSETENDYIKRKILLNKIRERKSFWEVFLWVSVILSCVCFSGVVSARGCSEWESLSAEQKYRLEYAYNYGKPYDLGWSMSSIAWQESHAGKYKINTKSKDYGLFQINATTIFNILGVTSYWKKQEIITKVVMDDALSAYLALDVLQHFQRVHKNDWKKMIMSYNIGNQKDDKNLKKGLAYHKKVSYYLNILKRCSNFN